MTMADLERGTLGVLLAATAIVAVIGGSIEARSQAAAQLPVVSNDPAVQRTVEARLAQVASVRLDPLARIGSLDLRDKPLREIIDAVAKAGGITVRYASGMTSLDMPSTITVSDQTVEDALRTALKSDGLTFQALAAKVAFIYPDTPANREKYTASNRVFALAKADPVTLAQQLSRAQRSPTDVFQAFIFAVQDPRTIIVRATPERMARIATWIADNDKDQ
jgi:type II secretory pathway component GspD/PulD (secretin)